MSPDGKVAAVLSVSAEGRLDYSVAFCGQEVLASSPLGLTLDGKDLGRSFR
jgi:hypothetical protein